MTRIYTCNVPIEADVVDAFCWLQKGFTDQFVYYDKQNPTRYMGLDSASSAAAAPQKLETPGVTP